MKEMKLTFSIFIILSSLVLCQQIISTSLANQKLKKDYAELNHVKYGLFSINKWKQQIATILIEEIDKFDLNSSNQEELKNQIKIQLSTLINKIDAKKNALKERMQNC